MYTRRHFLAAAMIGSLLITSGQVLAAPPLVEIVAMPHPPVKMALAPLREWLAEQGRKLQVREVDSESATGKQRMVAAGLSGHIPVLILVDGQHRFVRKDGSKVSFVNFPNVPGTPPGARGDWQLADVQAAVEARFK